MSDTGFARAKLGDERRLRRTASLRSAAVTVLLWACATAACESAPEPAPEVPVGIDIGDRAPDLEGVLATGQGFRLTPSGSESTVVVFYRSAECGLCRVQLEQMQQHLPAYRTQRARLIAVTLDTPELTRRLLAELPLEYEIVSVDTAMFDLWGVMHPELGVALPATYIIDSAGVIRYRHVGRNAADRALDAGILTVLETMKES